MASRHALFRVFYTIGFTPWDGHPLAAGLRQLVEGTAETPALPPGSALDVGCGTGDASIYLAQVGWHVTGIDFTPKAVDRARAKARAADATVDFVHGDVTHLRQAGVGSGFQLIVDNGCFHGMSSGDRDRYVQEIGAAAAPDARLLMIAFKPGGGFGPPGTDQAEIERRFTPAWALLAAADEPQWTPDNRFAGRFAARFQARSYLLQRQ
ncbi:class I SAM-dependent methyltransferase [Mycobacterium talmoniae]|uniref:Methyltransferase type 12 n=1 Tax=Mycobacterium talmoniae TaxID=1858794 RepID=A0A1S1NJV7_9MYCO|nr:MULTISPECIES: class I SAM-dependent methyltransferase [Mycobacterium]OHV06446.1 methyltransferase type 12 [Mycobacterium talmoniae]PQM49022.1 Ubiquinone biosynthesis O-methyltransferase [Mycobacterium talmoniae]TDH57397.1 class I SAM-dependent methyltransferase [Mycobacterium eburneum]